MFVVLYRTSQMAVVSTIESEWKRIIGEEKGGPKVRVIASGTFRFRPPKPETGADGITKGRFPLPDG